MFFQLKFYFISRVFYNSYIYAVPFLSNLHVNGHGNVMISLNNDILCT